ncbi:hypothetical protein, partial [Burkholderia multivorans]|uniref:hypothetical protein n=1 Tax=Burkholderia multivorans TaxID=87883 RepID=UPI0021BF6FFC
MNGVIDGDAETPAAVADGYSWSRHESRYYPEEVISRFGWVCRCMVRGAGTDCACDALETGRGLERRISAAANAKTPACS